MVFSWLILAAAVFSVILLLFLAYRYEQASTVAMEGELERIRARLDILENLTISRRQPSEIADVAHNLPPDTVVDNVHTKE